MARLSTARQTEGENEYGKRTRNQQSCLTTLRRFTRTPKRFTSWRGRSALRALQPHLDHRTQASITSIGGSNALRKTNWSKVREAIKKGINIVFIPDRDGPGEKYTQTVAQQLHIDKLNVIRLGGERKDGYDIADWLREENEFSSLPQPVVEAIPIQQRPRSYRDLFGYHTPEVLEWLEDDMIPARKLTMLVGRSAIGKSAMALYIASATSNGRQPFQKTGLGDDLFQTNRNVLIYSTEDDWDDTIGVRLKMMGADLNNIAPLFSQRYGKSRSFDWSGRAEKDEMSDLDLLTQDLTQHPVTLLVIDPLIDVITGGNNNDPAVIRQAIETKINPILATGCTVLGIHHERKDAKKDDLLVDRAIGSQAWTGVARSVLHMQALPRRKALGTGKNPKPRTSLDGEFTIKQKDLETNSSLCGVLVVSKNNLAKVDGGWHYELPTRIPDGQTSCFIEVAINQNKITMRTPEELVQIYNPLAPEQIPESAVNHKARMDIRNEVSAFKTAKSVMLDCFKALGPDEQGRVPTKPLMEAVIDASMAGEKNAKQAIQALTDSVRDGNKFYRVLKEVTKPE